MPDAIDRESVLSTTFLSNKYPKLKSQVCIETGINSQMFTAFILALWGWHQPLPVRWLRLETAGASNEPRRSNYNVSAIGSESRVMVFPVEGFLQISSGSRPSSVNEAREFGRCPILRYFGARIPVFRPSLRSPAACRTGKLLDKSEFELMIPLQY